ncbi:thiol reductase thioredoxin [Paenibacillus selenitireducens]|uniref:Thiol reductase thioredoxin n=1 Tax=Paenibacillus selenitireducens TaxID=1324314 RepID=A0A1T2XJE2_9BACL|nr:thioredoxin family protein [Paenibacillus selenitireducens]OPA80011.1 thiol reductase thioredoxin [Paenibacillus selenitireducens]
MEKLTSEQQFQEVIHSSKPTMAVFKAVWCKDCHFIDPFMPEVERKYADKLTFVHIDRDELPDLCEKYNILGIPSFIAFVEGQELIRFVSKLRKTREEIEEFMDRAIAVADSVKKN